MSSEIRWEDVGEDGFPYFRYSVPGRVGLCKLCVICSYDYSDDPTSKKHSHLTPNYFMVKQC